MFSGDGTDPRDKWSKTLGVYRRQDGSRCAHSNELSRDQASHLVDRMRGYVAKQKERADMGVDIQAVTPVSAVVGAGAGNLDDALQKAFTSDTEERAWLHGVFGADHVRELDRDQCETALALVLALNTDKYDELETRARSLGRIR